LPQISLPRIIPCCRGLRKKASHFIPDPRKRKRPFQPLIQLIAAKPANRFSPKTSTSDTKTRAIPQLPGRIWLRACSFRLFLKLVAQASSQRYLACHLATSKCSKPLLELATVTTCPRPAARRFIQRLLAHLELAPANCSRLTSIRVGAFRCIGCRRSCKDASLLAN